MQICSKLPSIKNIYVHMLLTIHKIIRMAFKQNKLKDNFEVSRFLQVEGRYKQLT
jgi:hypothetical protein